MFYFAFGSNLSSKRLCARVPSARYVTVAALETYSLRFHKKSDDGSAKADAYETGDIADKVYGVVFEIDPRHKPELDEIEGVGWGYEERAVRVRGEEGEDIEVFTYCALAVDPDLAPYDWYLKHVLAGAEEFDLPTEYVRYIRSISAMPDEDHDRRARELAIHDEA